MNDCPNGEMRDLLPDLLHGRVEGEARRAIESHVATCDDCRAELALLSSLRGTMQRPVTVDVGAIASAVRRAQVAPARSVHGGWATRWRAAAAILAVVAGGTSVAIARHESTATSPVVAQAPVAPQRSPDTVVQPPQPTTVATTTSAAGGAATRTTRPRELAVSGAVSDLSDRELAELLGELKSLEVLPSADVEAGSLVSPSGVDDMGDVL